MNTILQLLSERMKYAHCLSPTKTWYRVKLNEQKAPLPSTKYCWLTKVLGIDFTSDWEG